MTRTSRRVKAPAFVRYPIGTHHAAMTEPIGRKDGHFVLVGPHAGHLLDGERAEYSIRPANADAFWGCAGVY